MRANKGALAQRSRNLLIKKGNLKQLSNNLPIKSAGPVIATPDWFGTPTATMHCFVAFRLYHVALTGGGRNSIDNAHAASDEASSMLLTQYNGFATICPCTERENNAYTKTAFYSFGRSILS